MTQLTLNADPWTILYTKHVKGEWGRCYWDEQKIEISRRAKGKKELETLIHEMCHATNPWIDEDFITRSAIEVSDALWEMGYRKP